MPVRSVTSAAHLRDLQSIVTVEKLDWGNRYQERKSSIFTWMKLGVQGEVCVEKKGWISMEVL